MSTAPVALDAASASPAASQPAQRERDPWPDNAKLVLIILVAVGHLLSKGPVQRMPAAASLYVWIYLFHMPAFIFVAGFFSKSRRLTERSLQSIVTRVLVPYAIFTVLYAVALKAIGSNNDLRIDFVNPYWLLWFLPALAGWRLLTPLVLNLRWPLAISLLVGLGAGSIERIGADYALSRILAFGPFFVLGALVTPERLRLLTRPAARVAGAVVLVVSFVLVVALRDQIGRPPALFWETSYAGQHHSVLAGAGIRMLMYVIGTTLLCAVLAVVPTRRTWLTAVGAASLYIYLLHGFAVRGIAKLGLLDVVTNIPTLIAFVLVTAAGCILLGSPPVRWLFRPIVEPPLGWLLRPVDDDARSSAGKPPSRRDTPTHPEQGTAPGQASKSSSTLSETGTDWQASTKPAASSSGSKA